MRGYVRYMDDCVLWGDSTAELRHQLHATRTFLSTRLDLTLKESPYINRVGHGLDFLGARVFPTHMVLNHRGRARFRRKLKRLERAFLLGRLNEAGLQQRATALVAFTRTPGLSASGFRLRVLEYLPVSGHRPRTG